MRPSSRGCLARDRQAGSGHADTPSLERVTAAFPHLEILELIGAGGMGAVFKARQTRLGRLVALKVLPEGLAGEPTFSERFSREAHTVARLSFVDGVNLRQAMRAGRFTPEQALTVVPKICEAPVRS